MSIDVMKVTRYTVMEFKALSMKWNPYLTLSTSPQTQSYIVNAARGKATTISLMWTQH